MCDHVFVLTLQFAKTFLVEYHFEEQQYFKLILYDIDDDYHIDELYKQEYMGEAEFCLAELITCGSSLELPLRKEGMFRNLCNQPVN